MAHYFLCLDANHFLDAIRPALAASWRRRSFEPCRALCQNLLFAARKYVERYGVGDEPTLLERVADGLSFDRGGWRLLVGEVLLFAAVEIPELQTNEATLRCLLAPENNGADALDRSRFAAIQQVLCGSRDLTFGGGVYRPEHAGYNDPSDVARLADYLAAVRPETWTTHDLLLLRDLEDEDERADELAFVREWFPVLVDLYQRCCQERRVVILENVY